jgi:hypothetical protein
MAIDPQFTSQDSALLDQVRERLREPKPRDRHWTALAAAAFFAACAIGFAVAAVLAPPLNRDPAAKTGVR